MVGQVRDLENGNEESKLSACVPEPLVCSLRQAYFLRYLHSPGVDSKISIKMFRDAYLPSDGVKTEHFSRVRIAIRFSEKLRQASGDARTYGIEMTYKPQFVRWVCVRVVVGWWAGGRRTL